MTLKHKGWLRGLIAGLVGGLAWLIGIIAIFGPAQALLADPDRQSAKFLAVFIEEPLPRAAEAPWVVPVGILVIGVLWGWVYVWISPGWPGKWWQRGLKFGVVGWVLMAPRFEFYLPWNVLLEPGGLVVLELVLWLGVLLLVGLTIAGVERIVSRP